MRNTISERIADFLRHYPPFSSLLEEEVQALAMEVTIHYKAPGEKVFSQGEPPHPSFYVVHKGAVALQRAGSDLVVDLCDEGDIFGLRPLMANENYQLEATPQEETILYGIPIEAFRPLAKGNLAVSDFMVESFASNTRNPYSRSFKGRLMGDPASLPTDTRYARLLDLQPVPYSSDLVSCAPGARIADVARKMGDHQVGAMLVVADDLPIGILTDRDIRDHVGTGAVTIDAPVSAIMSTPVITYRKTMTVTQVQMAMMKSDIDYLVLTEDGTPNTRAVGIVAQHDLMVSLGNNPTYLVKAIKRTETFEDLIPIRQAVVNLLKGYLEENIPMGLVSKIISELNDATTKQVLRMATEKMERKPPVRFAWLPMGSLGRSEQLLHTDQDNALVFEDVPETDLEATRAYFLELAGWATLGLNTIGYAYCPADMMATNTKWCKSLSEFKRTVSGWIDAPGPDEVLLSSIFFDYNFSYGDRGLVNALSEHIFQHLGKRPLFFMHLASGALQNPSPSGFFRTFLLEQDGAHKDFFDLKKRALMPLIDAARVLILHHRVRDIGNTAERYEKVAELEPQNAELFLSCSYAFKALLKFRVKQGLLNDDSGRYISIEDLSKEEKVKLKRTFKIIKDIQELISIRFMTSRLS